MAKLATQDIQVVQQVAAQTAALLINNPRYAQHADAPPLATLHEYFPLWILGSEALERLRRDVVVGIEEVELCSYLERSPLWLYLLHRRGQPAAYVLSRAGAGGQRVIEVSETTEAIQLSLAVTRVDDISKDEALEAVILDCPRVGAAALLLMRPDGRAAQVCQFRNPAATSDWTPGTPVAPSAFIESLLDLLQRLDTPVRPALR